MISKFNETPNVHIVQKDYLFSDSFSFLAFRTLALLAILGTTVYALPNEPKDGKGKQMLK